MSNYSPFLSLELPELGEYAGVWHIPANANFTALDALFSGNGTDEEGGTGHVHDGVDGSGPRIAHSVLKFEADYAPTNTHEDLDDHVADAALHPDFGDFSLAVNDGDDDATGPTAYPSSGWNNGPGGADAIREIRFKGATLSSPATGVVVIDTGLGASGGTGPAQGVPTHLPSTSAPVVAFDDFDGVPAALAERNWYVNTPLTEATDGARTGDRMFSSAGAAGLHVDPARGSTPYGYLAHRIKTQVPHSAAQRVSLFVDRCDVSALQAGDSALIALAVNASAFFGSVAGSTVPRDALLMVLHVINVSGTNLLLRYLMRTLTSGSSTTVQTLWQSAPAPLSDTYGVQGAHEFSVDHNHAAHYYYNNGKVDLGVLGDAGALTPTIVALTVNHQLEYAAHSTQTVPEPVAPPFGRFGFDVSWLLLNADSALKLSVRHFAASSTDDAVQTGAVSHAGEPRSAEPDFVRRDDFCCGGSGVYAELRAGDPIDVPRVASDPQAGTDRYRIVRLFGDGDPDYGYAGFTVRREAAYFDVEEPERVVYCTAMGAIEVDAVVPARPGERARIRLRGPRIPELLQDPVLYPADPTAALAGTPPTWGGAYPQAIPYPTPAAPGALGAHWYDLVTPPDFGSVGSFWPDDAAVDDRVVRDATWTRRDDGSVELDFQIADGVPYGSALTLVVASRTSSLNSVSLPAAIRVHPPQPRWTGAKFFRRVPLDAGGGYEELTTLPENETVYAVLLGRGMPTPITPAGDGTAAQTVWSPGFPFDGLTDTVGKFALIDAATGAEVDTAYAAVSAVEVYKGAFAEAPTAAFPPVSFTPASSEGETVFVTFSTEMGSAGRSLLLRAAETADPSVAPADLWLPEIVAAVPVVTAIEIAPDIDAHAVTAKTVTVTGRNFNDVSLSSSSTGLSALTLSTQTDTEVVFTCITASANDVAVRIENASGEFVDAEWTVSSADAPAIASVLPTTVTAFAYDQTFTLSVANLSLGAFVSLSNGALPIRDLVVDVVGGEIEFVTDVLNLGGVDLTVTVTLPNGETDSIVVAVTAPTTPTISSFAYYATAEDYAAVTPNARGKEIGQSGFIKIVGTGFRAGATATSSNAGLIFGAVTVVGLTEIKVAYQIPFAATIGAVSTITVTDRDGDTDVTSTITIEGPTPQISDVFLTADYAGAGDAAYPAGSAAVTIVGSGFAVDGVAQVDTVNITGPATAGTLTVVSDTVITLDELVLDADSAGDSVTIELETTGGKTAEWSFDVQPPPLPTFSWTLHPGTGQPALVPPVIVPNASGYVFKFSGSALTFTAAALSGPFSGSGTVLGTPTPSTFEIEVPDVDAMVTGDPMIRIELTVPGQAAALSYDLLPVDTAVGAATDVDALDAYQLFEGSGAAMVTLTGTDLAANTVASVSFDADEPELLPFSVEPTTSVRPIYAVITEQSATKIVCRLTVADNIAGRTFTLALRGPDGGALTITAHQVTVAAFPERARFDYDALPTFDAQVDAANDLTYDLLDAVGGEYLQVDGGENVVLVATGDPTQVRVQFDMPSDVGAELEVRLLSYDGALLSVHRTTTTA